MNEQGLATELLHELKASAKRWFIAFLVMVGVEIATIAGFIWYISLPVEEINIEQEADRHGFNIINSGEGDVTNGGKTTDKLQTQGGAE